jgi:hypothetical protein
LANEHLSRGEVISAAAAAGEGHSATVGRDSPQDALEVILATPLHDTDLSPKFTTLSQAPRIDRPIRTTSEIEATPAGNIDHRRGRETLGASESQRERQRDRESERERERQRQRESQRERDRERESERETERQRADHNFDWIALLFLDLVGAWGGVEPLLPLLVFISSPAPNISCS